MQSDYLKAKRRVNSIMFFVTLIVIIVVIIVFICYQHIHDFKSKETFKSLTPGSNSRLIDIVSIPDLIGKVIMVYNDSAKVFDIDGKFNLVPSATEIDIDKFIPNSINPDNIGAICPDPSRQYSQLLIFDNTLKQMHSYSYSSKRIITSTRYDIIFGKSNVNISAATINIYEPSQSSIFAIDNESGKTYFINGTTKTREDIGDTARIFNMLGMQFKFGGMSALTSETNDPNDSPIVVINDKSTTIMTIDFINKNIIKQEPFMRHTKSYRK